jgi:hypothetical protein
MEVETATLRCMGWGREKEGMTMRVPGLRRWAGLAVLGWGLAAWGQATVPVTIEVKESTGLGVPHATLAFFDSTNMPGTKLETNANGRATAELAPGNYKLLIESAGFEPVQESLSLATAMDMPVVLRLAESCPPCQRVILDVPDDRLSTELSVLHATIQSAQTPVPSSGYTPVTVVVTDASGAVVPGAEIRVTPGSPAGDKQVTDEQGRVQLGIPAGTYKLHVTAQGFAAGDQSLVVGDGPQTVTVSLTVGQQGGSRVTQEPVPMSPGAVPLETTVGAANTSGAGTAASAETQPAATTLTIIGTGGLRGVFTQQTLSQYPQTTVTVFDHHTNKEETYAGVPLVELLGKLGVQHGKDLMGKALAQYVVATGSDGYVSVVALGEVDPEFHPGTVLVADAMDGKPLDAKAGPFRLVVSEDKRPARSVRNLVRIEVRTAE